MCDILTFLPSLPPRRKSGHLKHGLYNMTDSIGLIKNRSEFDYDTMLRKWTLS